MVSRTLRRTSKLTADISSAFAVVFGAATLYLSVWTNEGLTVPLALEIETLGAL